MYMPLVDFLYYSGIRRGERIKLQEEEFLQAASPLVAEAQHKAERGSPY